MANDVTSKKFSVDLGWEALLHNLGLSPHDVLRHAGLPGDMLQKKSASLSVEEYFRLWRSLEHLVDDPDFPVKIIEAFSIEAFSPPFFAALCSPNFKTALERLAHYKPLIGPMRLDIKEAGDTLSLSIGGLPEELPPPPSFIAGELVFFVNLARLGTKETIYPLEVISSVPLHSSAALKGYLGDKISAGSENTLIFSRADTIRPFLSSNQAMLAIFEPELQRRLEDLNSDHNFTEKIRACLMEALPAGQHSIEQIAGRLALSPRTLQRRLKDESSSFQEEVAYIREKLALHYLGSTPYSSAEISFLLGYEDPNSFIRAFHGWTGSTPEKMRASLLHH